MSDVAWLCEVCGKSNTIDLPKCATCGRPSTYIPPTLDDLEGSLLEARVAASAKDAAVRQAEAVYAEATEAELAAEAELEEFKRRWEEEKAVWVSDPEVAAERAAPAKDGTPTLLLTYSGVETSLLDGMIHTKQSMMRRGTKELAGEPVARSGVDSIDEKEARDDEIVKATGGDADSTTGGERGREPLEPTCAPPSSVPRGRAERLRGAGGGKGSKEKTKKGKGTKKKGRR